MTLPALYQEAWPATSGRAVTQVADPDRPRSVLFILLVLTLLSSLVDAACACSPIGGHLDKK